MLTEPGYRLPASADFAANSGPGLKVYTVRNATSLARYFMHGTVRLPETRARIAARTTLGGWAVALLCLAVALALAVPAFRSGLFDAMATDDAMRLVEVRDLLAGQSWFDL